MMKILTHLYNCYTNIRKVGLEANGASIKAGWYPNQTIKFLEDHIYDTMDMASAANTP